MKIIGYIMIIFTMSADLNSKLATAKNCKKIFKKCKRYSKFTLKLL